MELKLLENFLVQTRIETAQRVERLLHAHWFLLPQGPCALSALWGAADKRVQWAECTWWHRGADIGLRLLVLSSLHILTPSGLVQREKSAAAAKSLLPSSLNQGLLSDGLQIDTRRPDSSKGLSAANSSTITPQPTMEPGNSLLEIYITQTDCLSFCFFSSFPILQHPSFILRATVKPVNLHYTAQKDSPAFIHTALISKTIAFLLGAGSFKQRLVMETQRKHAPFLPTQLNKQTCPMSLPGRLLLQQVLGCISSSGCFRNLCKMQDDKSHVALEVSSRGGSFCVNDSKNQSVPCFLLEPVDSTLLGSWNLLGLIRHDNETDTVDKLRRACKITVCRSSCFCSTASPRGLEACCSNQPWCVSRCCNDPQDSFNDFSLRFSCS